MTNVIGPRTVDELEDRLSEPSNRVIELIRQLKGDLLFAGVAGKMGPTIARMARRAVEESGSNARVIGVSRFSDPSVRHRLEAWGVETIQGDLLDPQFVESLPDVSNIVYMAGFKFGASSDPSMTWAMNCHVPALICQKFQNSRIVAFSTGNVYGMTPVTGDGSVESDPLNPSGEYAMSCLGRERIFEYFSKQLNIPVTILRLNYATELRYGVLVDLAQQVKAGTSVDLSMGYVNVIWQCDANAMALCALQCAASPALILNLSGPEKLRVRDISSALAERMDRPLRVQGTESPDAFLSNGQRGYELLGPPSVEAGTMIAWTADWLLHDGPTSDKPTKFQRRDGKF